MGDNKSYKVIRSAKQILEKHNNMIRTPAILNKSSSESDINYLLMHNETPLAAATFRHKRRRVIGDHNDSSETSFRDEIKEMLQAMMTSNNQRFEILEQHLISVKSQNESIRLTSIETDKSITNILSQLKTMDSKIEKLEFEKQDILNQMSILEKNIDIMERKHTRFCIEIRNVPKRKQESRIHLYEYIHSLYQTLNISNTANIRDVHRLPSKNEQNTSTIVVEFANTLDKSNILKLSKEYNRGNPAGRLNSTNLGLKEQMPIYINEQLTAKGKRLFYLARQAKKAQNYSYCWTANGDVIMRERDGMPSVVIKSEAQLELLKSSTVNA